MVTIKIPTHLIGNISKKEIKKIIKYVMGKDEKYNIKKENRGSNSGQYLILETDKIKRYICLSRENPKEGRNVFALQNLSTALANYFNDTEKNKSFCYFIRGTNMPHAHSILFAYKCMVTAKIPILNLDEVIPAERAGIFDYHMPFRDFKQMRKCRLEISRRHSKNNPTVFEQIDNDILVYGKTFGVNGRETVLICLALKELTNQNIILYNTRETTDTHGTDVDKSNLIVLKKIGIKIEDEIINLPEQSEEEKVKRDTRRYHINLLRKFHEKKCYLCECDIENLMVGSHIHRVADIKKETISAEEKNKQIIDGENGFWLCANHDKLFEYGSIYFDGQSLRISDSLTPQQKEYIRKITNLQEGEERKIKKEHYTESMHRYLEKHKKRVNTLYKTKQRSTKGSNKDVKNQNGK